MRVAIVNLHECEGNCGTLVRPGTRFCVRCTAQSRELLDTRRVIGNRFLDRPGLRWWIELGDIGIGIVIVMITLGVPFVLGCRDLLRAAIGKWW